MGTLPRLTPTVLLQHENDTSKYQIERRADIHERFGQERSRERQIFMTLQEFIDAKDPRLYLSTQQDGAQPCDKLVQDGLIPSTVPWAGHLRLESRNLWMGYSSDSSSGLHHDFHDNFYFLHQGRKTFRLYRPQDYIHMELYGQVTKLRDNGVISYDNSDDECDDGDDDPGQDQDEDDEDESEEDEVVLGKGFDYQSDSEEDSDEEPRQTYIHDSNGNAKDDFDELFADESVPHEKGTMRPWPPRHFSRIDPTLPTEEITVKFPEFIKNCECLQVDLQAGEVLYLPASWFHCVTSYGSNDKPHLAVNYWYYPPDQLDNYEDPYKET